MSNAEGNYTHLDEHDDTVLDENAMGASDPGYIIDNATDEGRADLDLLEDEGGIYAREDADALDASGTSVDQRLAGADATEEDTRPAMVEGDTVQDVILDAGYTPKAMNDLDPAQSGYRDLEDDGTDTIVVTQLTVGADETYYRTTRSIMSTDVAVAYAEDTIITVAQQERDLNVGPMPVLERSGTLVGIITDRDIVVRAVAAELDLAATTCADLIAGDIITVAADDAIEVALAAMETAQIRRLPVMDDGELVGIVTQADIARRLSFERVGELVEEVSAI